MTSIDQVDTKKGYRNHKEVPLAGYTDRLSARPGDTVKFYLSSTLGQAKNGDGTELQDICVQARLTSSISADPNPKGPGIIEKDASLYFEDRTIGIQHQPISIGSRAETPSNLNVSSFISQKVQKIKIGVWFYPTLIAVSTPIQNIWSWGNGFRLDLLPTGHLKLTCRKGKDQSSKGKNGLAGQVPLQK